MATSPKDPAEPPAGKKPAAKKPAAKKPAAKKPAAKKPVAKVVKEPATTCWRCGDALPCRFGHEPK